MWTLLSHLQPLHKLLSPGGGASANSAAPPPTMANIYFVSSLFAAVSNNVINLSVTIHLTALVLFKFLWPRVAIF